MNNNSKVGKLKFKQGASKPVYISKKNNKQSDKQQEQAEEIVTEDKIISYEPKEAKGTLTVSGRTIHGNQTKFRQEVQKGDSIIIQHPVFKTRQQRAVTLILSDKSILIEQPFLEDYSAFVPFLIRKKSKVTQGVNLTQNYKQKLQELGKTKGIKKEQMNVRLKKGMWSYQTKKVQVQQNLSREQLLNLRQKMIKDKHCW